MYKQRELISNNPEQLKEIVDLYKSGMLIKDIEKQLGISDSTIYRRLVKQGIKIKPMGMYKDASTYLDRKYNYFKNIKCYKY